MGNFDVALRHGNDSDWFFRARDMSARMVIVPEVLVKKRIHSSNMSHEVSLLNRELLLVARKSVQRIS